MKNIAISFKSLSYYNCWVDLDLSHKLNDSRALESVILSAVLTRKGKSLESSCVKLMRLIEVASEQNPQFYLTNSFATIRATVSRSRLRGFLFFLQNYLCETGRYTLSPISAVGKQANFIVRDYVYFANFLGVSYDFFSWRYPLRFTFNFSSFLTDRQLKFFFHLLIINP